MKKFMIIVPLTPKRLLTPIREQLFEIFLKNMDRINYEHWEAVLIGDDENDKGKIKYKKIGAESKELKLVYAREYLSSLKVKPDYVLRLDDDDLINPSLFSKLANQDLDCYADKYHVFYDVLSGRLSWQHRIWLANTVVHRYEYAMTEIGESGMTLLQSDHSKAWSEFYSSKKIVYAPKDHPVYVRVLSPVTVTSQTHNLSTPVHDQYAQLTQRLAHYDTMSQDENERYQSYLKGFGQWKNKSISDFKEALMDLKPLNRINIPDDSSNFVSTIFKKLLR
jgi:hypothetical protein